MNLIPADLRASINQGFEDLFNTFARSITFTIYKNPEETVVSIGNDYSSTWDVNPPPINYKEVKKDFPARIWFLDYEQQFKNFFLAGKELEGVRAIQDLGQVKIQLRSDGAEFLKDASRAYFLDQEWEVTSDVKSVGIFEFNYHIFVLRRRK